MNYSIEIEVGKDDPNAVGELLRDKFWKQGGEKVGCYSTFEYRPDVVILTQLQTEDSVVWNRVIWNNIECRWYWDGDGVIVFAFPDHTLLVNYDCKKGHTWEWEEDV